MNSSADKYFRLTKMNIGMLSLLVVSICSAQPAQWQEIFCDTLNIHEMEFVSPTVGFGISIRPPYSIYRTTDGGYSWEGNLPWSEMRGHTIEFFDEEKGIVCGSSTLAITEDGGDNWEILYIWQEQGIRVNQIAYVSEQIVIGIETRFYGDDEFLLSILRSADGGHSWTTILQFVSTNGLEGISISDDGTILIHEVFETIWRSTDSGLTWNSIEGIPEELAHIAYAPPDRFFASTALLGRDNPKIFSSTDDGLTWDIIWQDSPDTIIFRELVFTDTLNGWAIEQDSMILETHDGGLSWQAQILDTTEAWLGSATFINSNLGWCESLYLGVNKIFRYDTGSPVEDPPPAIRAKDIEILCAYPNPFNPSTTISFDLTHPGMVKLRVFDVTGRMVSTLVDGNMTSGAHQVMFDGKGLSSGIYFTRLEAQGYVRTRKMALIR